MKYLLTAAAIFTAGVIILHAGDEKTDLERFQGKWTVVSLTEEGKAVEAAELAVLEITVEKDIYTATEKGEVVAKYRFKIDPTKKPSAIDFTPLIGKEKEKATEIGIYVFDKDTLKMCVDEQGKVRPEAFEGKGTEKCSIIVLKKK